MPSGDQMHIQQMIILLAPGTTTGRDSRSATRPRSGMDWDLHYSLHLRLNARPSLSILKYSCSLRRVGRITV